MRLCIYKRKLMHGATFSYFSLTNYDNEYFLHSSVDVQHLWLMCGQSQSLRFIVIQKLYSTVGQEKA